MWFYNVIKGTYIDYCKKLKTNLSGLYQQWNTSYPNNRFWHGLSILCFFFLGGGDCNENPKARTTGIYIYLFRVDLQSGTNQYGTLLKKVGLDALTKNMAIKHDKNVHRILIYIYAFFKGYKIIKYGFMLNENECTLFFFFYSLHYFSKSITIHYFFFPPKAEIRLFIFSPGGGLRDVLGNKKNVFLFTYVLPQNMFCHRTYSAIYHVMAHNCAIFHFIKIYSISNNSANQSIQIF